MINRIVILFFLICLTAVPQSGSFALDTGHPVAVRRWSGSAFTIETMSNLHVGMGLTDADRSRLPSPVGLDVGQLKSDQAATLTWARESSKAVKEVGGSDTKQAQGPQVKLTRNGWQTLGVDLLTVDGLVIANLNAVPVGELEGLVKALEQDSHPDTQKVLIATASGFDATWLKKIADQVKPQTMIVAQGMDAIGDQNVDAIAHNTVAVSAAGEGLGKESAKSACRFISLGDQPWKMSGELKQLFAKKEASCQTSRAMFAKLSINQLNFKPSDGSHTPRWNTEHMMGRELLFFSQIYHAVDPWIAVMDLNPRQMPNQYSFAHPNWSGAEEAAQTERVQAFTRRFAYLLDGMDLDQKAKGSRFWTPRGLLEQMDRHYKQHSDNVIKKMKLENWPEE